MPHPKSALKRHRQSLQRRARNQGRTTAVRSAVRRARELIASGAREEAEAAVRAAGALLDRTARKGVIHPNNAARRKSRLMHRLHTTEAPATAAAPRTRRRQKAAETEAPEAEAPARKTRTKKS